MIEDIYQQYFDGNVNLITLKLWSVVWGHLFIIEYFLVCHSVGLIQMAQKYVKYMQNTLTGSRHNSDAIPQMEQLSELWRI